MHFFSASLKNIIRSVDWVWAFTPFAWGKMFDSQRACWKWINHFISTASLFLFLFKWEQKIWIKGVMSNDEYAEKRCFMRCILYWIYVVYFHRSEKQIHYPYSHKVIVCCETWHIWDKYWSISSKIGINNYDCKFFYDFCIILIALNSYH